MSRALNVSRPSCNPFVHFSSPSAWQTAAFLMAPQHHYTLADQGEPEVEVVSESNTNSTGNAHAEATVPQNEKGFSDEPPATPSSVASTLEKGTTSTSHWTIGWMTPSSIITCFLLGRLSLCRGRGALLCRRLFFTKNGSFINCAFQRPLWPLCISVSFIGWTSVKSKRPSSSHT